RRISTASASTRRPASTSIWCRRASSTRPRSYAPRSRTPRRWRASSSPPRRWSPSFRRRRKRRRPCRAAGWTSKASRAIQKYRGPGASPGLFSLGRGGADAAPPLSGNLVRLDAHELAQQCIEARAVTGVEIDAADLLDQPLERLELLQPQEE